MGISKEPTFIGQKGIGNQLHIQGLVYGCPLLARYVSRLPSTTALFAVLIPKVYPCAILNVLTLTSFDPFSTLDVTKVRKVTLSTFTFTMFVF